MSETMEINACSTATMSSVPAPISWLGKDAPEYEERKNRAFVPPNISIKDVHAAVPRKLFEKNTAKGLFYFGRHVAISALCYVFATQIDQLVWRTGAVLGLGASESSFLSWACWIFYWFWQSVCFAGMWTLGALCVRFFMEGRVALTAVCLVQDTMCDAFHGVFLLWNPADAC